MRSALFTFCQVARSLHIIGACTELSAGLKRQACGVQDLGQPLVELVHAAIASKLTSTWGWTAGLREALGRPLSHLVSKTLGSLSARPNQLQYFSTCVHACSSSSAGTVHALA